MSAGKDLNSGVESQKAQGVDSKPPSICRKCNKLGHKECPIFNHSYTMPQMTLCSALELIKNPSEQGVLSNEGWTKDRFPEWKEKEPTFELIEKYIPPRGITCKDCMRMGNNEQKIEKEDLMKMFRGLEGQKIEYPFIIEVLNPFYKKYLEEE